MSTTALNYQHGSRQSVRTGARRSRPTSAFRAPSSARPTANRTTASVPGSAPIRAVIPTRWASLPPGTRRSTRRPDRRSQVVPVTNYAMSWGDNYAGGPLMGGLPWETPPFATVLPPARCGSATTDTGERRGVCPPASRPATGTLRGFADYSTMQIATIASVTDGTSNTILVGEVLPLADANNDFWTSTGSASGTTVPLGWDTNSFHGQPTDCNGNWQGRRAPLGCRYCGLGQGLREPAPRRGQLALRRRLGPLPQEEHQHADLLRPGKPQRRRGHQLGYAIDRLQSGPPSAAVGGASDPARVSLLEPVFSRPGPAGGVKCQQLSRPAQRNFNMDQRR